MSRVYVIKPLEKKSIVYHVEMYRNNPDGTISWFNLDETYRWGQGFIEEDLDCNLPWEGDKVAYAKTDCGWGCEFDDSISIEFEFSDDLTKEQQEEIREAYYEGGAGWLYEGEHDWQEEDAAVHIWGPYKVSLCKDDGEIITEHVKLRTREDIAKAAEEWRKNNNWPFETAAKDA